MIDPVTAQKIKDTADIVDVVSDYVHLVRRGANYMGLCPFHNERTPSFSVNRARNFCYCFSCHKGGSPVNFIMEKEGISYSDALKQLARKYGIEVQERELSDEEREEQSKREGMFVANEWAKNHFIENLETQEGKDIGLSYIYGRKVTPEAIKAFQLGYAIDKSLDLTDAAIKKGFSLDILKSLGLTGTSQQGHNYDKFRGRVIFPVLNSSGKTVAFGGRDLKGGPAKYINSPESEIYSKSRELYGIFQAKGTMVRENKCYLVEGYLDVIGLWQSGVKNVVASSGTALTDGQISLIHRFTDNVTLIYDGDSAGIKASLRGIDMLLAHNLNVKAVPLPEGEDPDSLAAKLSTEELRKYLEENETDIIRFKIKVMLEDAKDDPQKRWQAVRSIVESIANISDKIKRDIYVQECSELLGLKESTLSSEVGKARYNIIQQEKLKRRQDAIRREFPVAEDNKEYSRPASPATPAADNIVENNRSPLYPLEHSLILNCLRYGFVTLWESEDENDPEGYTTAIEYVNEELSIDNITFTNHEFKKVFDALISLLPDFRKDFIDFKEKTINRVEKLRKEGYDNISKKSLSIQQIKREETKLEEELELFLKSETENFSKNYISDKFASHEDNVIRNLTNESMLEKHQLSTLFTKNKTSENDNNIIGLILTSINVLKNGILDENLKELMNSLKNTDPSDTETQKDIHERIKYILQIRSNMAKDIGDRVLCPQPLRNKKTK